MQVISYAKSVLLSSPAYFGQVAIQALPHYPVLRRLEITGSRLGDVESFLLALFEATHRFWIETHHLLQSPRCTCGKIEMNLKRIKHIGVKTTACRIPSRI